MQNRPPIVVVMGHIDHGKTTLLDYIRKTSVAAGEAGGITQHIGAYEVNHGDRKITFLDTPGHEAFAKMRSRGARVADLAILVVAADDGVKPQTKEALETIKSASLPFAVAINKIDKPNANAEKVMGELAEAGVFLEGRGGNVPYAEISAKQGTGVDRLLETILLLAELENISDNPKSFASGVVIESHRDRKRGVTSTLLLLNGTLKKGEYAVAGDAVSKIRILENFKGEAVESAGASQPAVVVGFDKLPPVGAGFKTYFSQKEAADAARAAKELINGAKTKITLEAPEKLSFGLVIKSDVLGSAEAILHEIAKLNNDGLDIKILRAEAGDVSEDDIKMAASSEHPFIVAFKVSAPQPAREFAQRMNVEVAEFDIIYEVADWLKKKMEELAPKKEEQTVLGRAKILKIFLARGGVKGQIIGGEVIEGVLRKNSLFNLLRRDKKIGEGTIDNLQQGRINMPEVGGGGEFGALAASVISIAEGDILEIFR